MEQPTYHRMNRLLIAQGLDYQTIEQRALMELTWRNWKATSKQDKLSFSIPFLVFHYPLGHFLFRAGQTGYS